MEETITYIKYNGLWTPIIFFPLYLIFNNFLLSLTFFLKLNTMIYYYHFSKHYKYKGCKYIKPWVRFTDTSYIATIIYFINNDSDSYGLAFTVHALISIGYWIGWKLFGVTDLDDILNSNIDNMFCEIYSSFTTACVHGVPFILLHNDICKYDNSFSNSTITNLKIWILLWISCIYLPWRTYSGDAIYSVFKDFRNIKLKIQTFILTIFLINITIFYGDLLQKNIC